MGTIMKVNRAASSSGGGSASSMDNLVEKEALVQVAGNSTLYIPLEVGFHSFDIRSVLVTNDKGGMHEITIYDKKDNGDILYKSLQETSTYDIAAVPGKDKDGTKSLHVYLKNLGNVLTNYRVVIKLTQI